MAILGIIPARYDSSRFPGKPLADIGGKSMIQRVYEQSLKSAVLQEVIVATDDRRIFDHVTGFGGKAVMTSTTHRSGTERCREAWRNHCDNQGSSWDAVINIQGDEPFISPAQIDLAGLLLNEPAVNICTLVKKIARTEELLDPNVVKVVLNRFGEALYFSRSPIPFVRGADPGNWLSQTTFFKHIGIYGYKSDILDRLPDLPPSEPEIAESLEQLRWLSNGLKIKTAVTLTETISIDTPDDLLKITNIS